MTDKHFSDTLSYAKWWLKNETGNEDVLNALHKFTAQINRDEPETLTYLIYRPDVKVANQPTVVPTELLFIESYATEAAFNKHLTAFINAIGEPYKSSFFPYSSNPDESFVLVNNCARYRPHPASAPSGFIRPDGFREAAITQYAKWWVKPEKDKHELLNALYNYSIWVKENEPGTLMYIFTNPEPGKTSPPAPSGEIDFVAAYLSEQAQQEHYNNWNTRFLSKYKDYFVVSCNDPDVPFIMEENLSYYDGFIRQRSWE